MADKHYVLSVVIEEVTEAQQAVTGQRDTRDNRAATPRIVRDAVRIVVTATSQQEAIHKATQYLAVEYVKDGRENGYE